MYVNLKPATVEERLQMARSFNTKHFGKRVPSLDETLYFLKQVAPHYKNNSWRNCMFRMNPITDFGSIRSPISV